MIVCTFESTLLERLRGEVTEAILAAHRRDRMVSFDVLVVVSKVASVGARR